MAREDLMEEMPHIYWTPYVVHCIDLMLKDIGDMQRVKSVVHRGQAISKYVYIIMQGNMQGYYHYETGG